MSFENFMCLQLKTKNVEQFLSGLGVFFDSYIVKETVHISSNNNNSNNNQLTTIVQKKLLVSKPFRRVARSKSGAIFEVMTRVLMEVNLNDEYTFTKVKCVIGIDRSYSENF